MLMLMPSLLLTMSQLTAALAVDGLSNAFMHIPRGSARDSFIPPGLHFTSYVRILILTRNKGLGVGLECSI
jgi:hypothetical protein